VLGDGEPERHKAGDNSPSCASTLPIGARPGRLALDPTRKSLLDQIGVKGHHTDLPRPDGPGLGGDAYHPTNPGRLSTT